MIPHVKKRDEPLISLLHILLPIDRWFMKFKGFDKNGIRLSICLVAPKSNRKPNFSTSDWEHSPNPTHFSFLTWSWLSSSLQHMHIISYNQQNWPYYWVCGDKLHSVVIYYMFSFLLLEGGHYVFPPIPAFLYLTALIPH